jgi:hypothetical protein
MTIDLNDFTLSRAILEVRYTDRPLIWDQIGGLWQKLFASYPGARVRSGEPKQTVVQLDNRTVGVIELEKAYIAVDDPGNDLALLLKAADPLVTQLVERLSIELFTRLGFRVNFERKFSSKTDASVFLLERLPFPRLSGKHFNIEGKLIEPTYGFRWEGDNIGCHVQCTAQTQQVAAEFPFAFRDALPEKRLLERHIAIIDVDYYTTADTPADLVKLSDLLPAWLRAIRRDIRGATVAPNS